MRLTILDLLIRIPRISIFLIVSLLGNWLSLKVWSLVVHYFYLRRLGMLRMSWIVLLMLLSSTWIMLNFEIPIIYLSVVGLLWFLKYWIRIIYKIIWLILRCWRLWSLYWLKFSLVFWLKLIVIVKFIWTTIVKPWFITVSLSVLNRKMCITILRF